MKYQRILRAMHRMPWCILPDKLAEIIDVVQTRSLELERPDAEALVAKQQIPEPRMVGDVAVIPLRGTIAPRMNVMMSLSGGTSSEIFRAQVMAAADDNDVEAILIEVDSPGGSAQGIPEAADAVFAARSKKPVVALVNTMAASAAYWIASQASQIVSIPSGDVGSIGVFMLHQDFSQAFEAEGIKNTLIKSSPFKAEGNPFEPLSEEDRDEFQRVADMINADFHRAVARGRGLSVSTVRSDFGQGRLVMSKEAVGKRMIDRLETPERTLQRLQTTQGRRAISQQQARMTPKEFESTLRETFGFTARGARNIANQSSPYLAGESSLPGDDPGDLAPGDVRDELTADHLVRDEQDDLELKALSEIRVLIQTAQ